MNNEHFMQGILGEVRQVRLMRYRNNVYVDGIEPDGGLGVGNFVHHSELGNFTCCRATRNKIRVLINLEALRGETA